MRISEFLKGILLGALIASLIQVPAGLVAQQNTTAGRVWATVWSPPTGSTFVILTGTCPAGTSEVSALDGKMPYGTLAAHGDVGGTGGSNTITPTGTNGTATTGATSGGTPAGTISASFTGDVLATHTHAGGSYSAAGQVLSWPVGVPTIAAGVFTQPTISWPAGVPTISGTTINSFSSVINHTHTVTVTYNVQGGTTAATTGTHVMTSTATGGTARAPTTGDVVSAVTANPAGGVASITPTINSPGAIAWPAGVPTNASGAFAEGSISWPAGVPTAANSAVSGTSGATSAGTPSGSVSASFNGSALSTHTHTVPAESWVGDQFDNRSAYVKVIYCQKT
jgi:hypothetical protein